tara:strand:+ start:433515 stop:435782 length:2268 start_codon:yes stop_codon:yes gene_type:complete
MKLETFKNILECFSDEPDDIEISKGQLVVQIRNELISAELKNKDGELIVCENDSERTATKWIIERIAHLPQLADRIINYIEKEEHFITPEAKYLPRIDLNPFEKEEAKENAVQDTIDILTEQTAGITNILYLTSDAGEGKTTLINEIAYKQAENFKKNRQGWLLLPITLGGRPFLRFDDVIIGSLMNKFRFPFFYYDAFLELVKLGVIIPAFDGFEEMFVESSTGEALSALSSLIQNLNSSGSLLISARKAYFEYKDFRSQAKLYDSIDTDAVSFSKLTLKRWSKKQFLEYSKERGIEDEEEIYSEIEERLNEDHPLLTRAVLVKRLIDVAISLDNRTILYDKIGTRTDNYFYNFVETIVEREVSKKWVDRSGEASKSLLSLREHYILLSMLANEMWISNTTSLTGEILELISDLFSDQYNKSPNINRQIKERITQHSLLVNSENNKLKFQFDHEEFKDFFLGVYIGMQLERNANTELLTVLKRGSLPKQTIRSTCSYLGKTGKKDINYYSELLAKISQNDSKTSFTRENCGALILKLLNKEKSKAIRLNELMFPPNSFRNRRLRKIEFINCYFQATEIKNSELINCSFKECKFDRLDFSGEHTFKNVLLERCEVNSIITDNDNRIYNPNKIPKYLSSLGFTIQTDQSIKDDELFDQDNDQNLAIVEKVFRTFLRSTFINEDVFKVRLGTLSPTFFDKILPELLRENIIQEVPYKGSGSQKRYKLTVKLNEFENALKISNGNYNTLLENIEPKSS